jgi:hypothetical protein
MLRGAHHEARARGRAMIAAALVLAAYAGTVEVADRTEIRARATQGLPVAFDAVTIPSARAAILERQWSYTGLYAPTLTLQDMQASVTPVVLHAGSLAVAWHDRIARVTLREEATYGRQNTANLALLATGTVTPDGRPPVIQALPQAETITTASSRTTLATELRPARRVTVAASVSYNVSGGLDAASRAVIPQQRGPFAEASVGYAVSRVDLATGALAVARSDFTSGPCIALQVQPGGAPTGGAATPATTCAPQNETAVATAGWRHTFSRRVDGSIGAGISEIRTRLSDQEAFVTKPYAAGSASLGYRVGLARHVTTARLEGQVAPVVDLRTGVADDRAQVTLTVASRSGDLALTGSGGAARSFGNQFVTPATFLTAATEAQYDVGRHATVGAGVRYFWQNQRGFDAVSSAIVFASLTVRSSALRF